MKHSFRNISFGLIAMTTLAIAPLSAQVQTSNDVLNQLDPDMRTVVQIFDQISGKPVLQLTPQDARQQFAAQDAAKIVARTSGAATAPTPVGKVIDGLMIPGENDTKIPIRIYYPRATGTFPVIVYFHGGGFVVATIDTYDESARNLCVDSNAIVVSVEYRKAPEAPFPAAYNDAITAYRWVTSNIANYDGIASKVAVAGESAGGNLAAEVAIAAKNGEVQKPTHQLLIYPETTSNLNQSSNQRFTDPRLPLYQAELPYFDNLYLQNPSDKNDPRAVPIDNKLNGVAPATIIAAAVDPLLSDGQDYYKALMLAQVPVQYRVFTGVTHEFFGMGAVVAKARRAEMYGAQQIAASFSNQ